MTATEWVLICLKCDSGRVVSLGGSSYMCDRCGHSFSVPTGEEGEWWTRKD